MQLGPAGLALIKVSEGFRPRVYTDIAGLPTVGYGHRLQGGESFPDGIDEAQGEQLLAADVAFAERCVTNLVHVDLTEGQFDALVDFTFNLGAGRLASSTLLKDLNAGLYETAAHQLLTWDHGLVGGQEEELAGLKSRRGAEYQLWHQAA
jgi:lysozyme